MTALAWSNSGSDLCYVFISLPPQKSKDRDLKSIIQPFIAIIESAGGHKSGTVKKNIFS